MRVNFNYYNRPKLSFEARTLAVTGNIASGKSTVQKMFERNGIKCIDVDNVVHSLYEEDLGVINAVKRLFKSFGISNLEKDNFIDRKKIRTIVFQNKDIRHGLEDIVHPAVENNVQRFISENDADDYVAVFNPLLFETGKQKNYDYVALIKINPVEQLNRLLKRNSFLTAETAKQRIASQLPQSMKEKEVDFVIDNSFGLEETEKQVVNIINILKDNKSGLS